MQQRGKKEVHAPDSFVDLVKKVGYMKARQSIKQVSITAHQKVIDTKDHDYLVQQRPKRVHTLTLLSKTLGTPVIENKIVSFFLYLPAFIFN